MTTWSTIFGICLVSLWLVGLVSPQAASWMTWLDGAGGLLAFLIASTIGQNRSRSFLIGAPAALGLGLFAMWMIGILTNGTVWQNWWNFAIACGFVLVATAGGRKASMLVGIDELGQHPRSEKEQERIRRTA